MEKDKKEKGKRGTREVRFEGKNCSMVYDKPKMKSLQVSPHVF